MKVIKKRDGFIGESAIVLPEKVIKYCESRPLVNSLFITDIGYYPKAKFHYRERRQGIDQNILIYCVDGRGESIIHGKKFLIHASNYLIIPAWKRHFYKSDHENPWTIYWIHFKGSNADVISELLYKRMMNNNNILPYSEDLIEMFQQIFANMQMGYSKDKMIYTSLTLSNLLYAFIYPHKIDKKIQDEKSNAFEKVITYLKDNIHKSLKLNEIASVINISPSHFSTKFKEFTGFSPIEYFIHLKLQKACHLLRFSKLRISEVAFEVGITDPQYFSRLFNFHMGSSPKDYRNKKLISDVI